MPIFPRSASSNAKLRSQDSIPNNVLESPQFARDKARIDTAIVYCEANFGAVDGKTANGLVRHSERCKILSVIDSEKAGLDAGTVLDNEPNGIPICHDLAASLTQAKDIPDYFIFGMCHRAACCRYTNAA